MFRRRLEALSDMLTLAVTAVLAAASPVQRAEQLYQQARYEEALKALPASCGNVRESDAVTCERVRAFALVALGRESDARAAFDRMLVRNPDVDLGADVSPKLQSLFSAAKRELAQVMSLTLEPVTPGIATAGATAPWPLSVRVPGDVFLDALHAYVATASTSRYTEVALRPSQNGVYLGMYEPAGEPSAPRYYLVATLSSGVDVSVGDPNTSKTVVVNAASGVDPITGVEAYDGSAAGSPTALMTSRRGDDDKIAGLPPWAFWGIVGGSAAVVTAVIVIFATRGGDSNTPGSVRVGLTFQ